MGVPDFGDKPELRRASHSTYLPLRSCFVNTRMRKKCLCIFFFFTLQLNSCDFVVKPQQINISKASLLCCEAATP